VSKAGSSRPVRRRPVSTFKTALADLAVAKLGPIGAEMVETRTGSVYINPILADGSQRAGNRR
jgi:tryptophanyl-tRNA synthetase